MNLSCHFSSISNISLLFDSWGWRDNTRHFIFSLIIIPQLSFARQKSPGKKPRASLPYASSHLSPRYFGGRSKQCLAQQICDATVHPALSLLSSWASGQCSSGSSGSAADVCDLRRTTHSLLFAAQFLFCKTGLWRVSVFTAKNVLRLLSLDGLFCSCFFSQEKLFLISSIYDGGHLSLLPNNRKQ